MSPFKVLYSTHASNLTGASRSLLDMLDAFDRTVVEPIVLLRKHGKIEGELDAMRIPYTFLPYVQTLRSPRVSQPVWLKKAINARAAVQLKGYLRDHGIDIVHNNSLLSDVGMRAAMLAGIPYVSHVREFVHEDHGGEFLDDMRMHELLRSSDTSIFISEAVAEKFIPWLQGASYMVAHNGISVERYVDEEKEILGSWPCRVLLAGRFAAGKGQLEALKAVRLVRERGFDVSLMLIGTVGSHDYLDQCKRYIDEHRMDHYVTICSFCDDLRAIRHDTDIELICSTKEAMGRVTAEGMLSGSLVIGADTGATPEIIANGETGLLYKGGDEHSLAEAMIGALSAPDVSRMIAAQGQRGAMDHFDNKRYVQKIYRAYEHICSRKKGGRRRVAG